MRGLIIIMMFITTLAIGQLIDEDKVIITKTIEHRGRTVKTIVITKFSYYKDSIVMIHLLPFKNEITFLKHHDKMYYKKDDSTYVALYHYSVIEEEKGKRKRKYYVGMFHKGDNQYQYRFRIIFWVEKGIGTNPNNVIINEL